MQEWALEGKHRLAFSAGLAPACEALDDGGSLCTPGKCLPVSERPPYGLNARS